MLTTSLLLLLFPFAMVLAAASDLLSMTIPNRIPAALLAGFLVAGPLAGLSASDMAAHLVVFLLVLGFAFGCFAAGWMGGGDAKLIAAAALWLGPSAALLSFAVHASLLGGALTLLVLNARALVAPATGLVFLDRLLVPRTGIPYGIALGAAGLMTYPDTAYFALAVARLAG